MSYQTPKAIAGAQRMMNTAHEAMTTAWDKMHDRLGGPVDEADAKELQSYMDAFRAAANDYCALAWYIKRGWRK